MRQRRSRCAVTWSAAGLALTAVLSRPVAPALAQETAEAAKGEEELILFDFESASEVARVAAYWPVGRPRQVAAHGARGTHALAFTLPAGRSRGFRLSLAAYPDWRTYDALEFDLTPLGGEPCGLWLLLHDAVNDNVQVSIPLKFGAARPQHCAFTFARIPGMRKLDLSALKCMTIYAGTISSDVELAVDSVRLRADPDAKARPQRSELARATTVYPIPSRRPGEVEIGRNESTGEAIRMRVGKGRPFVEWAATDIAALSQDGRRRELTLRKAKKAIRIGLRCAPPCSKDGPYEIGDVASLGLAYSLTQDLSYAHAAKDILLAVAREYRKIAARTHPYVWGYRPEVQQPDYLAGNRQPGRCEGQLLARLAGAFDLVADSGAFSAEDRAEVGEGLFRLGVRKLREDPAYKGFTCGSVGLHTSVGIIGCALEDAAVTAEAVRLFQEALGRHLLEGGFWIEGPSYGQMAIGLLKRFAWTLRRSGADLFYLPCRGRGPLGSRECWTRLIDGMEHPLLTAAPDMSLPKLNDSMTHTVSPALVEELLRLANKPFYAAYRRRLDPRHANEDSALKLPSLNWPGSGLAVLRTGTGVHPDDRYVLVDYGPYGPHGHRDLLQTIIYGYGAFLADDRTSSAGSRGYTALNRECISQAFAHNTIVVNEQEQRPVRGACRFFAATAAFRVIDVSADEAYEGAALRRIVALTDDFIVIRDLGQTTDGTPAVFDWCFHGTGVWKADGEVRPAHGFRAYKHIDWRTTWTPAGPWSGTWREGDRGLRLSMAPRDATVYEGAGPYPLHSGDTGHDPARSTPFVLVRQRTTDAEFHAVLEPFRGAPAVRSATWPKPAVAHIALQDGRECHVRLAGESASSGPAYSCMTYRDGTLVRADLFNLSHTEALPRGIRITAADGLVALSVGYEQNVITLDLRAQEPGDVEIGFDGRPRAIMKTTRETELPVASSRLCVALDRERAVLQLLYQE